MSLREAIRQWRREPLVVYCPQEDALAMTSRSFRGPTCSACGTALDDAKRHLVEATAKEYFATLTAKARHNAKP